MMSNGNEPAMLSVDLPIMTGRLRDDGAEELIYIRVPQMTSTGFEFLKMSLEKYRAFLVNLDELAEPEKRDETAD